MTRTTLVGGTAAVALLAFGAAALLANRADPEAPEAAAAPVAAPAAAAEAAAAGEVATEAATEPAATAEAPAAAAEPATDVAAAEPVDASEPALIRPYSPVLGPADAPVTIVEFFDPSCEACRAFHPVLQSIREQFPTQVRIVMRYTAFHEGSDEAVRILEAARAQGMFEPILNALLERQPEWAQDGAPDLDRAWAIAGEAGLDVEAGQAYRQMPGLVAILNTDWADVEALGIQQTPTFFVDGEPLAEFGAEELVAAVRARVEALPPAE